MGAIYRLRLSDTIRNECRRRTLTTPADAPHHDLPSFLSYASRAKLSPTRTIYVGTHYEYIALRSLARFGLSLSRTGGRLDRGIDLLGSWRLPSLPQEYPLRVLLQCKATSRKAGPNLIRELEGAFAGAPARWREMQGDNKAGGASGTMALLVTPSEATKGVRDAMGRSRWPMGFVKMLQDGRVEQVLWNRSAAEKGLGGVGVTTRFKPKRVSVEREGEGQGESLEQEIVLTWEGEIWEVVEDIAADDVGSVH